MVSLLSKSVLVFFMMSPCAEARKVALVMGASGENPNVSTTNFDEGIRDGAQFLKESGFETRVLYNGQHPEGRASISRITGQTPPPFDATNIEAKLTQLENEKFAAGDQVAIVIETHGWDTPTGGYHCVMMEGKKCWSPARLEKVKEKLEKQGVKLAILDHSCFSGSTLGLQGPNTCVITGADHKSFALIDRGPTFWAEAKKNRAEGKATDLETIFAQSRASETKLSSPRISTQTDRNLRELEKKVLELRSFDLDNPRHVMYLSYKPTSDQAELIPDCINTDFTKQLADFGKINQAIGPYPAYADDVGKLAVGLKKYNELRLKMKDEIAKIEKTAIDTVVVKGRKIPIHLLDVQDKLLSMPAKKRDETAFFKQINFGKEDSELFKTLKEGTPNRIELNKIRYESPAATRYEKLKEEMDDYTNRLHAAAEEVSEMRNRIFSEAYKQTRIRDGNACSEFKF